MRRRSFLRTAVVSATLGSAGCIGGGSEIVTNVQQTVEVQPGAGWVKEIPDVSGSGGAITYIARSDKKFDVYFFEGESDYEPYNNYTSGHAPGETPDTDPASLSSGNTEVGETATETDDGEAYRAASKEDGGRIPIEKSGPYYFVLDHSNYPAAGGAFPRPHPNSKPCQVNLDLTVSKQQFSL